MHENRDTLRTQAKDALPLCAVGAADRKASPLELEGEGVHLYTADSDKKQALVTGEKRIHLLPFPKYGPH